MKIMPNLVMNGSKDFTKHPRAHKISLKQLQYETKICSKPTLKNKGDKNRVEHMREKHLQRQSNLVGMGNKANMKVNTLDMPQKAT
jgi:hypothetical protein